jgi:hypothetical protein
MKKAIQEQANEKKQIFLECTEVDMESEGLHKYTNGNSAIRLLLNFLISFILQPGEKKVFVSSLMSKKAFLKSLEEKSLEAKSFK